MDARHNDDPVQPGDARLSMAKTNGSKSRKESGDSSPALARLLQTRQRAYPQGIRKKRGAFVSAFAPGSATDKESRLLGLRYVVPSKNGVAHLASAVINLSEGRLLSVTEHQTTTSKY